MDKDKLKQKFEQVYSSRIEPYLLNFERERIIIKEKAIKTAILLLVVIVFLFFVLPFPYEKKLPVLFIALVISTAVIHLLLIAPFLNKLKRKLLPAILSVFGKFYLVEQDIIPLSEIKKYQLFPQAESKTNDDVIAGNYRNLDIYIQESSLTHTSGSGKNTRTVIDFEGIFVKVRMQKRFKGLTVVRAEKEGARVGRKLERVNLEDPEFEKIYNVFSDDQIEARYILTTAFMQRLKKVREVFAYERPGMAPFLPSVSCAFNEGYIILAIETLKDFFEVGSIWTPVTQKENFEEVFYQMATVFELIYCLKLEENIGL